ncbi:MAG: hypothetical protein N3G21_10110 [Candidatus Hydrogenedentes bacterium]|nr:hypothetical protein [Candidatus Hydrogenedentota bacterium]
MNQQRQILIAGILFVVLCAVLTYQFVIAKPKTPSQTPTAQRQTTKQAEPPKQSKSTKTTAQATTITQEITPNIEDLEENVDAIIERLLAGIQVVQFNYQEVVPPRNPMTPLVGLIPQTIFELETPIPSTEVAPGQVLNKKISAIIWDEYQPLAIVDDKLVPEGYIFPDQVQVYKIEPNRVVLKFEESLFPVRLKEQ